MAGSEAAIPLPALVRAANAAATLAEVAREARVLALVAPARAAALLTEVQGDLEHLSLVLDAAAELDADAAGEDYAAAAAAGLGLGVAVEAVSAALTDVGAESSAAVAAALGDRLAPALEGAERAVAALLHQASGQPE